MLHKNISTWVILILLSLAPGLLGTARAQGGYDPTVQTQTLLYDEAQTVYLGNLARRDNGVPPLRWNLQLTHASRWFSWDSTENRPGGFCGHQDTQGHWPDYRALAFGYLGSAGAENAFCGYVTPESAIQGWMNSPGHRANLLDPNSREIGLGYYRRSSDGRGYVTQGFGNDAVYAPIIIENEAISTTNPNVNLYIYNRSVGDGFAGLGTATQMMVSNNAYFSGATWEPFAANKAWTLANGDGWREVYVKTRDNFNRNLTVSDAIYLGANVPLNELGAAQMSTTQSQVTLYNLNGGTLPQAQFSLGWLADDTLGTFTKWWGNGERINDASAWGGTAYRLYPGDGESFAWVYDTAFIKDTPLVAYFRLKVNDNTSSSEVARILVDGGGTEYGPLSLRGTDFTAPNQYQEFAVNFTFNTNPNDVFLKFNFWRSGNADVYVDAVSIFSAPQAITSPLTWSVPGNNYRGQGVWVRYTNGSQFSALSEAITQEPPHTISGNAGVGGATLRYNEGTAVADGSGNYSISVPSGWTGTITPSKISYIFTPVSKSYTNVVEDQTSQNYTVIFDNTPPTVSSVARANGNPTAAASVNFTATFSEPVTGVDTVAPFNDFALTTSGVTGATVSGVSGSGSIYTVTVSTGSGDGTIRLDVPISATITDMAGNPLASLPFAGDTYNVNKLPAAAILTAPIGGIGTDYNPNYTWNKVALATYYHLYVSGPSGVVLDQWYQSVNICDTTTCSVASPTLGGGAHAWYVQTWNPDGYGPWSNNSQPTNFSTTIPTAPAAAVLTAPTGNIGINYNPTYTWNKVADAAWYHLYVSGPSGLVLDQWYQSANICNTTTCSVASPTLGGGAHVWYVQTWNTAGHGPWSNNAQPTNFSTTIPTAPAAAVLTAPTGNIGFNYNPTYTWNKVADATYYHLYVAGPSGVVLDQWYQSINICNTTTCTVVSPTLGGGAHAWYVQTWNTAGYGPWSNNAQPTNFSTTIPPLPAAATLTAPIGNIGTNYNPAYTWNKVTNATWYRLYVSGPGGVVLDQWYQAVNICNTTICSVASPPLGGGAHVWYVQTWNSTGFGPWSNNAQPTNFSTTIPTVPLGAVLTAPSGTIASHTPTYQWNRVNMATWYHLYVSGPNGVIVDQWVQAANVCNTTICSVASPTLQSGDHTWWIQTYNAAGYGPWVSATFKVSP